MTVGTLGLAQAQALIGAALAYGEEKGMAPLSVSILDAGGHLLAFARSDGSSNLRPQIAMGKANGALALGVSSRKVAEMAVDRPTFIGALGGMSPGGIVPAAGGVLIRDGQGTLFGAIGITGDTSDNDEACALHALSSLGFAAAV